MKSLYLIALFTACLLQKLNACDCKETFSEFTPSHLYTYNHIKVCKPFQADTSGNDISFKAVVTKNYWGTETEIITIRTHYIKGGCGLPLKLNTNYFLYGRGNDSSFWVSLCDPHRILSDEEPAASIWGDEHNSMETTLNFVTKKFSTKQLAEFNFKSAENELKMLEQISGHPDNTIITYFTDGTISGKFFLKNGKLNGAAEFYYPNGWLHSKGTFTDNAKDLAWNEYTYRVKNGQEFYLEQNGNYKRDRKTGTWTGKMIKGTLDEYAVVVPNFRLERNYD